MKQIVTLEEFRTYNNYMEDGTEELCEIFIDSASSIVSTYLGYDPNATEYSELSEGIGSEKLFTAVPHIEEFNSVRRVDNDEVLDDLTANEEYIYSKSNRKVFESGVIYEVHYTGGWNTVPSDIKLAVLRISALMLSESNGNIGITSKSEYDQTRTFISYANYDKYLKPLVNYKSKRIC